MALHGSSHFLKQKIIPYVGVNVIVLTKVYICGLKKEMFFFSNLDTLTNVVITKSTLRFHSQIITCIFQTVFESMRMLVICCFEFRVQGLKMPICCKYSGMLICEQIRRAIGGRERGTQNLGFPLLYHDIADCQGKIGYF